MNNRNNSMKCPHCLVEFFVQPYGSEYQPSHLGIYADGHWWVGFEKCPTCMRAIVWLFISETFGKSVDRHGRETLFPGGWIQKTMVHPKGANRPPVPVDVPREFSEDYREACLVLNDSPKASAALSRRCLQHILREKAGVKNPNDLGKAIQEVVADPSVPTDISDSLDMVRNIGNFSVHPNKNTNTGEIVEVEPNEAEWCLETIEILFDYYFVRPANILRRRQAFNNKLSEAGKPTMPISHFGT